MLQKNKLNGLSANTVQKPVIEVIDICKTYFMSGGLSQSVLKNINFKIFTGEFVAIMGPSGSGKSTLMNILGCLDRPTSGDYLLSGDNVAKKDDTALARVRGQNIGFVFQNFNLLMKRTIADNVSLPLIYQNVSEAERRERALQMLEKVGLTGYADRLPSQISGGMQQRVAIARALINNPSIIFADEPTGNLDSHTSDEIMNLFTLLNKQGITVVLVTHEEDVADYADRMIKITDGRVSYDGLRKSYHAGAELAYQEQVKQKTFVEREAK
ncbi:MAG: ABC transporter ATP-binding protein [Alphaproteobacteria bacterium]|nr:ABC transporter ATP-binding protein [Alphaproteobacteria bacterium]